MCNSRVVSGIRGWVVRWSGAEIVPGSERQWLHVRWHMLSDMRHVVPVTEQRLRVGRGAERPLHPSPAPEVAVLEHFSTLRIYNNTTLTTQESMNMRAHICRQQFAFEGMKYELMVNDRMAVRSVIRIASMHTGNIRRILWKTLTSSITMAL